MDFCETFLPREDAFPKARNRRGECFAPLYFACRSRPDDDGDRWSVSDDNICGGLIPYLAAKYPKSICQHHPDLPMHRLVATRNGSLLNYRALYNSDPNCITEYTAEAAFNIPLPAPILSFLAERAPACLFGAHLDATRWGGTGTDHAESILPILQALAKIPKSCRSIRIKDISWDMISWMHFINVLEKKNISKSSWSSLGLETYPQYAQLMAYAFATNQFKEALKGNTVLESLEISGNNKQVDITEGLVGILQCATLKQLRVHSFGFDLPKLSTVLGLNQHLTRLKFHNCAFDFTNNLTQLSLALRSNKQLLSLEFHNCYEDHHQHASLLGSLLDALKEDNTTLQNFRNTKTTGTLLRFADDGGDNDDDGESDVLESIYYYTRLNRYGRQKARETKNTTKAQFVELLQRVRQYWDTTWWRIRKYRHLDKLNLCFGLLRECPSKWTSTWSSDDDDDTINRPDSATSSGCKRASTSHHDNDPESNNKRRRVA